MWYIRAQQWIDSDGPFLVGIALLEEKGVSTRHLRPRSANHLVTPAMKATLRQQVRRLIPESDPDDPAISLPDHGAPGKPVDLREDPPQVGKLRERGKRLMKQRSRLHAMLSTAGSDEERYEIAREMCVEVQPQIDQVYNAIREWEQTGAMPAAADQDEVVQRTVKKMQRRHSLMVRLRQLRAKLKKATIDKALEQQYDQEIEEKTAELDALNAELGL